MLHKEWTEAGVSESRVTSSGKGLPSHCKHLTWAKEKKNWTAAQWSKVLFQINSNLAFHLEINVWRKSGEAQNPSWLKSNVKFPRSVIWAAMSSAGVGPLCFIKCKVNAAVYQGILEHFMLTSADKLYGDADFIFQKDFNICPHCQNHFQVVCWPWYYCAWLASHQDWLQSRSSLYAEYASCVGPPKHQGAPLLSKMISFKFVLDFGQRLWKHEW